MGLPAVNTSPGRQYQLVTSNDSYSVGCHFKFILTEMGEIIRTKTERGKQTLDGILIDGCFKYCQTFFMQLYTILGTVNGHYMALAYCLLSNKTQRYLT